MTFPFARLPVWSMAAKCAQSTSSSHPATASMAFSIHRESQPLPSTKLHNENSLGFSTWTFLCLYSLFILIAPVCEWQKNSLSYISFSLSARLPRSTPEKSRKIPSRFGSRKLLAQETPAKWTWWERKEISLRILKFFNRCGKNLSHMHTNRHHVS